MALVLQIRILKGCGGSTIEDAIQLMVKKLMVDDLAASHSSKGKGGKLSFGQYSNVCEAMIGTRNLNYLLGMLKTYSSHIFIFYRRIE